MKMHLKILSAKWWPFCPEGDELVPDFCQTYQLHKFYISRATEYVDKEKQYTLLNFMPLNIYGIAHDNNESYYNYATLFCAANRMLWGGNCDYLLKKYRVILDWLYL